MDCTTLTSRPACSTDTDFLFELFASQWLQDLENWGWNAQQQKTFLRLQFDAQKSYYQLHFPDQDHRIVLMADNPIGSILVIRTDKDICLADIILLPRYHNQGIGTLLIQNLLTEAANTQKCVYLKVAKLNPAIHLYERLGFVNIGDTGTHFQMKWSSNCFQAQK